MSKPDANQTPEWTAGERVGSNIERSRARHDSRLSFGGIMFMSVSSPVKSFAAFGSAIVVGLLGILVFMPLKGQAETVLRNIVCLVALLFLIFGGIGAAASLVWWLVAEVGRRMAKKPAGGDQ